jgi:hypothetical protein
VGVEVEELVNLVNLVKLVNLVVEEVEENNVLEEDQKWHIHSIDM